MTGQFKLILPAILVGGLLQVAQAQNLPMWTFASFQNAALAEKMDAGLQVEDRKNLNLIATSLTALRTSAAAAYGSQIANPRDLKKAFAPGYWSAMSADYDSLVKSRTNAAARSSLLALVAADLAAKAAYVEGANTGAGFSGNFPSTVTVTVKTVDGNGVPRSNLYVRANPEAYGINGSPLYIFNSATSPLTTAPLPPGRAMLWVEDAAKHRLQSQSVNIGADGKDTDAFTIVVP